MIKGGVGGGNTITGLIYEGKVDLATYLSRQKNYEVKENQVRERLNKHVQELFNQMYSGHRDISIDDKYNIILTG